MAAASHARYQLIDGAGAQSPLGLPAATVRYSGPTRRRQNLSISDPFLTTFEHFSDTRFALNLGETGQKDVSERVSRGQKVTRGRAPASKSEEKTGILRNLSKKVIFFCVFFLRFFPDFSKMLARGKFLSSGQRQSAQKWSKSGQKVSKMATFEQN